MAKRGLKAKQLINRIKQLKNIQQNAICIAAERLFKLNQAHRHLETLDQDERISRKAIDKKFKLNLYLE